MRLAHCTVQYTFTVSLFWDMYLPSGGVLLRKGVTVNISITRYYELRSSSCPGYTYFCLTQFTCDARMLLPHKCTPFRVRYEIHRVVI
jgi:hypothetical protein